MVINNFHRKQMPFSLTNWMAERSDMKKVKIRATWGTAYDYENKRSYTCPVCSECKAPIDDFGDGTYCCIACGQELYVFGKIKEWLESRRKDKE